MTCKTVMLLTAAFVFPVLGKNPNHDCKATVRDNNGHKKEFHEGHHAQLGSWNDRITEVKVSGGGPCRARFWTDTNFEGMFLGPLQNDWRYESFEGTATWRSFSSIEVWESRRRIEADFEALPEDGDIFKMENTGEDGTYDPLCSAVYHELLETQGQMFANHTITEWAMQNIALKCEDSFTDPEDIFQCQFYAYAAVELFDHERILNTLRIEGDEADDMMEEYRRCGLLNVEINKIVTSGKLSGVSIEHHDDGDFFHLDEPLTADSVDLVPNGGGKFQAVVSAGALLAMWIGSTLVRVCRDFDVETGKWLLA